MHRAARWGSRLPGGNLGPVVLSVAVLAVAVGAPLFVSGFYLSLVAEMLALGVLGLALGFLVAEVGLISFGHAAFYGLGAYTLGIVLQRTEWGFVAAFSAALLAGALAAAVVGLFVVRVPGQIYFALLTLAFAQMVHVAIVQLYDFTGGDNGLLLRDVPAVFTTAEGQYFTAVGCAALAVGLLAAVRASSFRLVLNAIRDDPIRASALGINVVRGQVIAFTLSGVVAALGGIVAALINSGAFPAFADWLTSGEGLVVAVLGGVGFLSGPLVGAAIVVYLERTALRAVDNWPLLFGVVLLVVVLLTPRGIVGSLSQGLDRVRSRATPARGAASPGRRPGETEAGEAQKRPERVR